MPQLSDCQWHLVSISEVFVVAFRALGVEVHEGDHQALNKRPVLGEALFRPVRASFDIAAY